MLLEEAQAEYLKNDVAVAALIDNRLYPVVIPQDVDKPAAAFQRISRAGEHTHDIGPDGWATVRMQYTCQAATVLAAKNVAAAIREALDGFSGDMEGMTIGGCTVVNEWDGYGESFPQAVVRLDVMWLYRETEAI
jgi:hypothetical protein